MRQYPSALLDKAVGEFAKLPGIGRKTALRLVLHMLRQSDEDVTAFAEAVERLKKEVKYCRVCHNISDTDVCPICSDPRRDASTICVVENVQDVMAVENTQQFHGLYHVLGGIISPMDGIGLNDLEIDSLVERVVSYPCAEQHHGGRYHQLLYLSQVGFLSCQSFSDSPWHLCGRRTGVYRRGDPGTFHSQPHPLCSVAGGHLRQSSKLVYINTFYKKVC